MADQDDVVQVLVLQHIDDVGDEDVEVDGRAGQVNPVPQPGAGHRVDVMPSRPQQGSDGVPDKGPGPLPRDQHEGGPPTFGDRGSVLGGHRVQAMSGQSGGETSGTEANGRTTIETVIRRSSAHDELLSEPERTTGESCALHSEYGVGIVA